MADKIRWNGDALTAAYRARAPIRAERAYSRGWRDCAAKILHHLRRGATADEIGVWFDGPFRAWCERNDVAEPVPDLGAES